MKSTMKLFLGLMILSLAASQLGKADSADPEEDYASDKSDGDYDEGDYTDDKIDSVQKSTSEEPYKTHEYTEKSENHDTVMLKCLGSDINESSTVVMWYNGTMILLQGEHLIKDQRITYSKKDGSLTIKDVTAYDDAVYRCRIFGKERHETVVQLQVRGPPIGIRIGHNIKEQNDVSGSTLMYKSGEKNLRFKCYVEKARPAAKIIWVHNGNTILESQGKDHELKIEDDNLLIIKNLHPRHAGEYECEASNDLGTLKSTFKIEVQYIPFFTHHHSYFNAEGGNDVEIHCLYKAFPEPTSVIWLKGNRKITDSDKYVISNDMTDHHDRTKLLIRDVNTDDLITYQCEVTNELGARRENVTVDVGPAPAKFDGYRYISNVVFTDWIIKSYQDLTDLQILYRNKDHGWKPKNAIVTNKNKVKEGEWKVQGSIELEAGDWIIMARAKNTAGWSDDRFFTEIPIKVPKDSIESQNQTGSATTVRSTVCGLLVVLMLHCFA